MKTEDTLFGLFASFGAKGLPASALIALAEPLGITVTNVRTHLSRMCGKGLIEKIPGTGTGLYRFGKRGGKISLRVTGKLNIDETDSWDGTWIMIGVSFTQGNATAKARLKRRLHWYGFVQRQPGLYLRPCWPLWDWPEKVRSLTETCNLEIIRGQWLRPSPPDWPALWPEIGEFNQKIKALLQEIQTVHSKDSWSASEWHFRRFQLGNIFYPLIATDPLLPPEIFPGRTIFRELKLSWREYEEIARKRAIPFTDSIIRRKS